MSKQRLNFVIIIVGFFMSSCGSEASVSSVQTEIVLPTKTFTVLPTKTLTITPTVTVEPTRTPKPTQVPYDYHGMGFPLMIDDVTIFKKNFNCPTDYGDMSHDGNDIMVVSAKEVPIIAVDDGYVESSNFNESVGYEISLVLGSNSAGETIRANYVHLTKAVQAGLFVEKGDIIGYIIRPNQDHLHFELRIGNVPRLETPSDGALGDEIDVTSILEGFVPDEKIGYDDRYGTVCE